MIKNCLKCGKEFRKKVFCSKKDGFRNNTKEQLVEFLTGTEA